MQIGELLLLNKEKYTKAFIIENDESNKAQFTEIKEKTIDSTKIELEAKDYFMLDKEGIEEIFGNASELGIISEDQVLLIGI